MYDILKIQLKIVYIRCIDGPNTWKNSNSLNVQYHEIQWKVEYTRCTNGPDSWKSSNLLNVRYCENSMEIYAHLMNRMSRLMEKFKFVECTISKKFNKKLYTSDVQIVRIRGKIQIC